MGDLAKFFNTAAQNWGQYALSLSIIGGITMALVQTIKDLFPVRQWFQKYALQRWMRSGQEQLGSTLGAAVSATKAEADLITLSVDGDAPALYDLQIEQVCGQFTAAIQVVLEFPERHRDLLAITASNADPADLLLLLQPPPNPPTPQFTDARMRVTHQCQRAIDAFQIVTGFRWKWWLQIASIAISAGLAWVALSYQTPKVDLSAISVITSALLAGFLAPVAKDLLAVLNKARGQ